MKSEQQIEVVVYMYTDNQKQLKWLDKWEKCAYMFFYFNIRQCHFN